MTTLPDPTICSAGVLPASTRATEVMDRQQNDLHAGHGSTVHEAAPEYSRIVAGSRIPLLDSLSHM